MKSKGQTSTPLKRELASYIGKRLNLDDIDSSRHVLSLLADSKPLSQPEVAERLKLSIGTCNLHLQRLEHQGLLHRVRMVQGKRGRPTIIWDIDRRQNTFVYLVFDVPFLHAALVDFDGNIIDQLRCDLSGVSALSEIDACVGAFLKRVKTLVPSPGAIRQVVVSVPGVRERDSGRILNAANFPVLNGFDPRAMVSRILRVPCYIGILPQPYYFGETERFPVDQMTMVVLWDLGVGVIFGKGQRPLSFRGSGGHFKQAQLDNFGHFRVRLNGRDCHCGLTGCLESYVGGLSLLKEIDRQRVRTLEDLIEAAVRGDRRVLGVCQRAALLMGETLAWPIQALGLQRFRFTGALSSIYDCVSADFIKGLGTRLTAQEIARLNPDASESPQASMLRGAYLLAKQTFLSPGDLWLQSGASRSPSLL